MFIFTFIVLQWFLTKTFGCFHCCLGLSSLVHGGWVFSLNISLKPNTSCQLQPSIGNLCTRCLVSKCSLFIPTRTLSDASTVFVDSQTKGRWSNNLSQLHLASSWLAKGTLWWTCLLKAHWSLLIMWVQTVNTCILKPRIN